MTALNAMIVCGGLSTRLGEETIATPKILLPIGDRLVLDWQLTTLRALGISTVVLAAGHLSDVLLRDIGEERDGMGLVYAIEQEKLGTGGAIQNGLRMVENPEAPTIILNGDILTTANLREMLASYDHATDDGVILGSYVPDASTLGTLVFDDSHLLTGFKEKEGLAQPAFINGGIYVFSQRMHRYFPQREAFSIEYDVFPHVEKMRVYPTDAPWIDIGVPERLAYARAQWKEFLPQKTD